ncbi:MAG: Ig domain-containing protein [Terriglobales bacterium]
MAGLNANAAQSDPASTAPLAIATQSLPPASNGVSYTVVLAATGGTGTISWRLTAGQLPAGMALSASGALGGTPAVDGTFPLTIQASDTATPPRTATARLALVSSGPELDQYGGLAGISVGAGTGFFAVKKVGSRWVFVDPLGHPFWQLGVFDVNWDTETTAAWTHTLNKYGNSEYTWGLQAVRRLQTWGFNSTAEYSSAYVVPVNQWLSYETTDPMPWVDILRPEYYSLIDYDRDAPGPVKDLVAGLDREYTNYRGDTLPDVYDPNFAAWTNGYLAANTSAAEAKSPWLIGTAMGDLDNLWGFGVGPDLPSANGFSSNIGWIALCTNFAQSSNPSPGNSGTPETYANTEVYTKHALMNWLETKYGTIAALNAAWDSSYTTFGDAGGYGTGSGLLDEDGRDPWVGNDDVSMSTASAGVKADLNTFLGMYADQYFSVVNAALRKYRPNQLIFGPATMNGWNGVSRAQILQAAAQYCDVVQASMYDQQVYDLTLKAAGDHPFVTWTGMYANPDSDMSHDPAHRSPGESYATQADRGAAYTSQVEGDFAYTGSSAAGGLAGSQNVVGSKYWAWEDSSGEKRNWGLITLLDNPYDGVADTIAKGRDAWGYPTGGETSNYGNFIGSVTQANHAVIRSLFAALGGQPQH